MKRCTVLVSLVLFAAPPTIASAAPPDREPAHAVAKVPSKPTGPIAADYRVAGRPEVGVPLDVTITARVEAGVTRVGIEATATEPSAVLVSAPVLQRRDEGVYEWIITVVPLDTEAGYLSVLVSGSSGGTPQALAVTVSLRGSDAAGARLPSSAAEGENLISLPVQETP